MRSPWQWFFETGWYNTATKPHKTLGVDLTITASLMYVPSSDQFYLVDNTKLTDISVS